MGKIKSQAVGCDQRALLHYVFTKYPSKRRMQQMRGRMIQHGAGTIGYVDTGRNLIPNREPPRLASSVVHMGGNVFLSVIDAKAAVGGTDVALVANLASALRIKGSAVQHDLPSLVRNDFLH